MTWLREARAFLSGKKTYLIALGAIVAAVAAWAQGTLDNTQAVEAIVAALLALTMRAGVEKTAPTGGAE